MKPVTKSTIMEWVSEAISTKKDLHMEMPLKDTKFMFELRLIFREPDFFIDDNGVKWVREKL
jgi:hypothetical protein